MTQEETERKKSGLYQAVRDGIQGQECMLCTVLEGSRQGEKVLFCGGKKVWNSEPAAFLPALEEKLKLAESGLLNENGTRVFCERFGGKSRLVICGAGHVSVPVIEIGKMLGFYVTVLEDRPVFADHARNAGADEVICDSFAHGMERISGGSEVYFVIVTRGHRYDMLCLEQAVKKSNAYVGMMGSKKRVALVKEQLAEKGVDREILEQVHTPIGLSIGAQTPEEIAVSIMAEIIQVRSGKKRMAGYAGEILDALLEAEKVQESLVLAVIVSRKGSAPRKPGTKMLIYKDGRTVGTVGGGCMESEVVSRARLMLKGIESACQLIKLDMTGKDAEEEGMVCGGVVEVYLERSVW